MAVLTEPQLPSLVLVRGAPPPGFPVEPNTIAELDDRRVLWLGPDEWLVLGGTEADYPEAEAAVDVSAERVAFELTGPGTLDVIAQGCSLDLDRVAPGSCAQTLLARAPMILQRDGSDKWTILVRRSYSNYIRAWLTDASQNPNPPR
jgi:sarcosine oxidase subunit gamma